MLKNKKYLYGTRNVLIPSSINFGDFMLQKLFSNKDKIALTNATTNKSMKHGEIAQQALNLAVSLYRLGVRNGDMVAVISENRMEYFSTIIGAACVGATLTLINPFYRKEELKHATNISKPTYVVLSKYVYDEHIFFLHTLESVKKIILYGEERKPDCISYNDLIIPVGDEKTDDDNGIERLKSDVDYDDFVPPEIEGQTDVLLMLYSSGTTGLSKGVLLTHFNVITMCCSPVIEDIDGPIMSVGPWFHVMGLIGSSLFFTMGKQVVYMNKFDIDKYLKSIETYKTTMLFVAPAILIQVLKCEGQYDLSSVRRIISGSAPLRDNVIKSIVANKFPNLEGIIVGYGLTETTLAITISRFDDPKSVNTATAGKVVDNTIIKVVGPNQEPLGPYEKGEICTKGLLNMKGYVGASGSPFDDEGFFKTGDRGYYDDEGRLFVVDRIKELIKYKGNQVIPAELEALLLQHEAVRDAGVVGIPDEEAGELPVAFVALQPGMSATEKEIQDFVAERISKIKHLRGGVRFVPEIPKNSTGKILRHKLRNMAIEESQQ